MTREITDEIIYSVEEEPGGVTSREWRGSRQAAIRAAVDALDAEPVHDPAHEWAYYAAETDSRWRVTDGDMASLGAALLDGWDLTDAYSIWCAETDATEEPDDEDARADARVLVEADHVRRWRFRYEIMKEHGVDYLCKVLRLARQMREEA